MRKLLIVVGILILVGLGLLFISNMTGNTITGAVVEDSVMENEYFKIGEGTAGVPSEEGKINEEVLNESYNSSGSG